MPPLRPIALLALLLVGMPAAAAPRIVDRPIPFGPEREMLTLAYVRAHYDPQATDIAIDPQMIVVHWTDGPTAASAIATFTPARLGRDRPELNKGGALNVGSQFVIDRDGTIYRLMPETRLARHVIGLNWTAIGIENAGGPRRPLTAAQLEANAWLVRDLVRRFPKIRTLIGHYEYQRFRGSSLWKERVSGYLTGKSDPGAEFMGKLRSTVRDLGLQDRP